MKKIEDKSFVKSKEIKPEIKDPPKAISIDKVIEKAKAKEPSFDIIGDSTIKREHPKLAEHYAELNTASNNLFTLGHRSHDMKMKYTNEIERIRAKIREYEKNEGISREDHIRWNNG